GSVLPCCLSIQAGDPKALGLFSSPSAVVVCLQRRVRLLNKPSQSRSDFTWYESCEDVGRAVWWTASGTGATRFLEGEIKLPKDLRPTTSISHFSVTVGSPLHLRYQHLFIR